MRVICSARNGWIRPLQQNGYGAARMNAVSSKVNMAATNSLGWEVQRWDGPEIGWVRVSPIVSSQVLAEDMLGEYKKQSGEFRVYEALDLTK